MAEGLLHCRFSPDLMAGGSDCRLCGWSWEDHHQGGRQRPTMPPASTTILPYIATPNATNAATPAHLNSTAMSTPSGPTDEAAREADAALARSSTAVSSV